MAAQRNHRVSDRDRELVVRVQAERPHGTTAYRDFVRRFTPLVYGRTLRLLGNRQDAEDVMQDVFLRVYRGIDGYRFEQPVAHWLQTITTNSVRNHLRSRHREERRRDELARSPLEATHVGGPVRDTLLSGRVDRALASLEPTTRIAVLLRFVEELSYPEIATELGLGESAVKMRVRRAMEQLRGLLEASDGS